VGNEAQRSTDAKTLEQMTQRIRRKEMNATWCEDKQSFKSTKKKHQIILFNFMRPKGEGMASEERRRGGRGKGGKAAAEKKLDETTVAGARTE